MKRIQYWGLGALIILLAGAAVLWVQHERSEIRQLQQEAAEAKKLLEESKKDKETPKMAAVRSVGTEENDIEKISDADIEELLKAVAAEGNISDADIEELLKAVAAEEEEVKEALSAEEMAKRESQRKAKELWEKIGKIMQNAGGSIHTSTHPEEMQEVVRLLEEASGGPTRFTQMNNFGMMFQNSINSNGEMDTSEAIKMADYMEEVLGDTHSATAMRNIAQYAAIKGYEVINFNEIINADDYEKVLKAHYESTK